MAVVRKSVNTRARILRLCATALVALCASGCAGPPGQQLEASDDGTRVDFRPVLVSLPPLAFDAASSPLDEWSSQTPDRLQVDSSSLDWVTRELFERAAALDCTDPASRAGRSMGEADAGHVACTVDGSEKLILGPVELTEAAISSAVAEPVRDRS